MTWYAKLFGHYQQFGSGLMSAKNRKLFVKAHPSPDTREFLQWFVETGILQTFFHAHVSSKKSYSLKYNVYVTVSGGPEVDASTRRPLSEDL